MWLQPSVEGPCNSACKSWLHPAVASSSSTGLPRGAPSAQTTWAQPRVDGSAPRSRSPVAKVQEKGLSWQQPAVVPSYEGGGSPGQLRPESSAKLRTIDLTMASVILAGGGSFPNSYASKAACPDRIDAVLQKCCKCSVCEPNMPSEDLKRFCECFHKLPTQDRTILLTTCSQSGEPCTDSSPESCDSLQLKSAKKQYTQWKLLGKRVCRPRLLRLLGISPRTLTKQTHGHIEMRKFNSKPATLANISVDQFFAELWLTAAETLPEDGDDGDDATKEKILYGAEDHKNPESDVPPIHENIPHWDPQADLLHLVATLGSGEAVRTKFVQHQSIMDLWWQYVAWAMERCPEITPASYSTFWRRWYDRWYGVIMTRKKSQHAECQICSDYRHYIHYSHASPEDKCLAAKRWHEHLQALYRDRLIYWNVRFWSRRSESNVLSIIIDSMDKQSVGKVQTPRVSGSRQVGMEPTSGISTLVNMKWAL